MTYEIYGIEWYTELAKRVKYPYLDELRMKKISNFMDWGIERNILQGYDIGDRKKKDKLAKEKGYKNFLDYQKDCRSNGIWPSGGNPPMETNEESSQYFGIHIAERYIQELYDDPLPMPLNNPRFDWICKNGYRINCKARCLQKKYNRWNYEIDYNDRADIFILSGWDSRESLKPLYVWRIFKDEIIRGDPFWMRSSFSVTNRYKYILEMKRFELPDKLEKLKNICGRS